MGPIQRYLGPEVPSEILIWQDPVPAVDHELVDAADVASLKEQVLGSGLTVAQLVSTAWASAASFRGSDKRGGANGARIRLEPQNGWDVNNPGQLATVLHTLEGIQQAFNASAGRRQADLARRPDRAGRLGGGREGGPGRRGRDRGRVHARPDGRLAGADRRRVVRLPRAAQPTDSATTPARAAAFPAEYLLLDRANLLTLSAPEMTVLVGGLRVLGATYDGSSLGVLTDRPGTLTNDFFVNLLTLGTTWTATDSGEHPATYEARDASGQVRWTGSRADLVFGSNSELRALAEVYASDDAAEYVRPRLRRRLGQGDGSRPVRPRLTVWVRPQRGSRRGSPAAA